MVEYSYDAWGNHSVSGSNKTLGNENPFRYRGYYYDTETGLYYLQTRYYDPLIGRFINADSIDYADPSYLNGLNLYAYCNNNPVMNVDPTGHFFLLCLLIGAAAGAVAGVGATVAAAGASAIGTGLGGGALALATGGTISGGALVAVGAGAVVAGSALVSVGVVGGLAALNVVLASNDRHGEPNSFTSNGNSDRIYDDNGNLIYRRDYYGKPHYVKGFGYCLPHTHQFVWELIDDVWKVVKYIVHPF